MPPSPAEALTVLSAARTHDIHPFFVMELMKHANALAASGQDIIHMSIGEPDFTAPPAVVRALQTAVAEGDMRYTPSLGYQPLREAVALHYANTFGLKLDPERVVITAGASGALLLACAALVEPGAQVLMPDPSYPCNRHFVTVMGGRSILIPVGPEERFQLTASAVRDHWTAQTRGVVLASPSNPTGTSIAPAELTKILKAVSDRGGFSIVDEIYQGIRYGERPHTALSMHEDVFVINSFSKYFCMTGWRLGWMVVPRQWVPTIEKLAQNLFICASTLAQRAAMACFESESLTVYEERRQAFQQRRDYLIPALRALGFGIPVEPDGGFYIYADISRFSPDSMSFARALLENTGVCTVPGEDFGTHQSQRYLRLSYATSLERLQEAVARMGAWLPSLVT